jgi:hypothetical protein
MAQIYGTKFVKRGTFGDFEFMCNQDVYSNSLFIFNDNEEDHNICTSGGGNAIIRKYNKYNINLQKPKSAGIPTGNYKNGGYKNLTEDVIKTIDNSIDEIKELLNKYKYTSIYFSVGNNKLLGTSIFNVDINVLLYIDTKISSLSDKPIIYL